MIVIVLHVHPLQERRAALVDWLFVKGNELTAAVLQAKAISILLQHEIELIGQSAAFDHFDFAYYGPLESFVGLGIHQVVLAILLNREHCRILLRNHTLSIRIPLV